ncbi:MAG: ABC-type transporter Mla MlaB component [Cellvibrionaceae bacterium]|jgi:ABC-type transporter Mla MlaB component
MNTATKLTFNDSTLAITGDITFLTVADLYNQLQVILKNNTINAVDCGGVNHADSTAVSFLLAIEKGCKGRPLEFLNVDHSIRALAKLYSVDEILFR